MTTFTSRVSIELSAHNLGMFLAYMGQCGLGQENPILGEADKGMVRVTFETKSGIREILLADVIETSGLGEPEIVVTWDA